MHRAGMGRPEPRAEGERQQALRREAKGLCAKPGLPLSLWPQVGHFPFLGLNCILCQMRPSDQAGPFFL